MWLIDNSKQCLTINLEKTKEIMWKSVFEGEEGIDLTKVDTTRDISEFDPETQAAIQRASYDNHLKMLGKPTSQEKVRVCVSMGRGVWVWFCVPKQKMSWELELCPL